MYGSNGTFVLGIKRYIVRILHYYDCFMIIPDYNYRPCRRTIWESQTLKRIHKSLELANGLRVRA